MGYAKNMKFPEIGRMDRRVIIQSGDIAQHPVTRQETITWSNVDEVWANVEYPKSDEVFELSGEYNVEYLKIKIRYHSAGTTTKNRILYNNENYDIESFKIIGRNAFIELLVRTQR